MLHQFTIENEHHAKHLARFATELHQGPLDQFTQERMEHMDLLRVLNDDLGAPTDPEFQLWCWIKYWEYGEAGMWSVMAQQRKDDKFHKVLPVRPFISRRRFTGPARITFGNIDIGNARDVADLTPAQLEQLINNHPDDPPVQE